MNEMERQIWAAVFAAAFERDWAFRVTNQGVNEAIVGTRDGFQYAEVADQAVKSHRAALACDDSCYLLSTTEVWESR